MWGRILGQIWVSDSTRVIFELLLQFIIIESGPRFTEVWYRYMLIPKVKSKILANTFEETLKHGPLARENIR